jgi:hypothetical protein
MPEMAVVWCSSNVMRRPRIAHGHTVKRRVTKRIIYRAPGQSARQADWRGAIEGFTPASSSLFRLTHAGEAVPAFFSCVP